VVVESVTARLVHWTLAANSDAIVDGALMKINIEHLRPSIEALSMIKTSPLPIMPPVPDTRARTVDWHALTDPERKAIEDWLRDAEYVLPTRAAVFVKRHYKP
jgi:hypothetical protein